MCPVFMAKPHARGVAFRNGENPWKSCAFDRISKGFLKEIHRDALFSRFTCCCVDTESDLKTAEIVPVVPADPVRESEVQSYIAVPIVLRMIFARTVERHI